jgi:hypothetical protein
MAYTPKSSKRDNSICINPIPCKDEAYVEPEIITHKDIEYEVRDESYHYLVSTPFNDNWIYNHGKIK